MDDELARLERAVRERPDDLAAGWALARALRRAGDAAGLDRALRGLARLGETEAVAELERLVPFPPPSGTKRRHVAGPRRAGRTRTMELGHRFGRALAVGDRIVLAGDDALCAIDPARAVVLWTRERDRGARWDPAPKVRRGAIVEQTGDWIALRDPVSGERVAEGPTAPMSLLAVDGELGIAHLTRPLPATEDGDLPLAGVSLREDDLGRLAWTRGGVARWPVALGAACLVTPGRVYLAGPNDGIAAIDAAAGSVLWKRPGERARLVAADRHGVLVRHRLELPSVTVAEVLDDWFYELRTLDLATGKLRPERIVVPPMEPDDVALGDDVVATVDRAGGIGLALRLLSRGGAGDRPAAGLLPADLVQDRPSVRLCDGVVLVAMLQQWTPLLEVFAFDLAAGGKLFRERIAMDAVYDRGLGPGWRTSPPADPAWIAEVVPFERGVAVVVGLPGLTHVTLIDEGEAE